jgi:hypothetical protein
MAMLLGNAEDERCFSHGEKGETSWQPIYQSSLLLWPFPLFVIGMQLWNLKRTHIEA